MKTLTLNLIALLIALPALAGNGDGECKKGKYTREKKISKAYIVNSNAGLSVDNQFGSIYVTTWDEDKTQIEVLIKVSGNNEDKVNKRLETIDVDIEATKSLVSAKTRIGNMSGNNLSMEINYTIKIPKKGGIDLDNQYGSIITGKIYGKADIDVQYGDLNIDELNHEANSIEMQYSGSAKINYIKNGNVDAQYSGFNLGKAGSLIVKSQYTGVTIGEVGEISYKTEYGDVKIGKAGSVTGAGDYSAMRFGHISSQLNVTANYGDIQVGGLGSGVKHAAINATYTNVVISYSEGTPFDFEFNLEYGNLRGASGFKFTERSEKDNKAHYKGYYIKPGVNRIYIKNEYGDINLKS